MGNIWRCTYVGSIFKFQIMNTLYLLIAQYKEYIIERMKLSVDSSLESWVEAEVGEVEEGEEGSQQAVVVVVVLVELWGLPPDLN